MKVMTEEERVADEKRKAEKAERGGAELARRKKRDEDEAKFVAAEKARLRREAEEAEKARKAEEERRAKVRAELAERAEIERVYAEEKRAAEEAERARREAEAAAEMERKRKEEAERQARVAAERAAARERRGETSKGFDASMSVGFAYRAGRDEVEYSLRLRAGISAPATAVATLTTSESARVAALNACTEAARAAISSYASDQRAKRMMGDACPIGLESGGFDDVEFDPWMRVAQARLDAELRQLVSRAAAGLELTLRQPGEPRRTLRSRARRSCVWNARAPQTDYDNVSNRLVAAASAAADEAFGAATEDLDWVTRYELGQLHGMDGGLVFPAVTANDGKENQLKGVLVATMLNLSHWLARARSLAPDDEELLERCEELAGGSSTAWRTRRGPAGRLCTSTGSAAMCWRRRAPPPRSCRTATRFARSPRRRRNSGGNSRVPRRTPTRPRGGAQDAFQAERGDPAGGETGPLQLRRRCRSLARGQARRILERRTRAEDRASRGTGWRPRAGASPRTLGAVARGLFRGERAGPRNWRGAVANFKGGARRRREAAEDNWPAAALGAAREYGAARNGGIPRW